MRDYQKELTDRITFIEQVVQKANAKGIVYGNSGGKDSALVGILCKKACANVLGIMMPCQSKRNFEEDMRDAMAVARQFDIETVTVDLSDVKASLCNKIESVTKLAPEAVNNIAPRLRMATLYAIAQSKGYLVAGTGNRSEAYMGYFTKWGDGAYDFNPIADLTVTEIYEFLDFINAPKNIINKPPSAGLYEGQTDEGDMGISYRAIDRYILYGSGDRETIEKLERAHQKTDHKRRPPIVYDEK